jgi:hypothetical protein
VFFLRLVLTHTQTHILLIYKRTKEYERKKKDLFLLKIFETKKEEDNDLRLNK